MTYEYLCSACGHEWEADQPISAKPLKKCPACKRSTARRQISGGSGFILKGGGWYADGYGSSKGGSSKKNGASGRPSEDSDKAAAKPEKKPDTKPAKSGSKAGAAPAPA